jgi:nucleotide-binding universal stress UspA family protein
MPAAATTPRHLLLATDLSARCDRARDRALSLARAWGAKLTVVSAQEAFEVPSDESRRPASAAKAAAAALRAARLLKVDFADVADVEIDLRTPKGRPEDVVPDVAAEEGCDLIVTGIARNDPAGQFVLGSLVRTLARRAKVPVLVVRKRPRGDYERIVVASDLSDASAAPLGMALKLFPAGKLTLFHAFETPFRNWTGDKASYERSQRRTVVNEIGAFLRKGVGEKAAGAIRIEAERGDPAALLAEHGIEDADLVIVGTHGRTALMSVFLGSVATAILDQVPCDVLLVPARGQPNPA